MTAGLEEYNLLRGRSGNQGIKVRELGKESMFVIHLWKSIVRISS